MKRLSWKRIVAALGIVAMLASNLSDVATVYAAAATDGTASTESVQPQAEEQSVPSDGGTGDINVPSSGEGGDAITEQPSGGDDDAMAEQPSDGDGETKTEQPAGEVKEESSNSKQDADAQVQNKETAEDTSEEESTADIKQEKADDTDTSKNVDAIKDTTKAAAQENANEAGKHSVSLSFSFDSDDNTSLSTDVDQSGLDEDGDSVDVSSMVASGITVDQNTYQYTGASLKNDNDDSTITDSLSQLKKSVSDGNTTYQYMNTDGSDWSAVPDDADEITIVFHYQKEAPKEKAAPVIKGKISFTAIFDDEDSKAIPDHAAYSVPDFDTLSLTEQPIAIDGYTYKGAKVNGNAATEIIKTTATDDDGNKTCTYTYDNGDSSKASTIDGTTAEITFVYTPAEKKNVESIVPTVKCVDEDGKTIKNSTDTLPTFENSLALGDTDKAPVTLKGYTYKNAKIGSTVISSLTKEEKEDKDTGAKTTVYSYTADGASDATVIDEATEITLVFTKDAEEKAISISLSWVDENGDKIEGYAKKDLPSFDDKLTLDDTDKAPLTIKGYTYTEARIGKTVISSLTKEEKEDKDTGDKTTVYSYTADDKTVEITDDTTITLAYKADAKEAKLTLACVDEDGNTIDGYAKKDLPSFDDKLVLNDTDKAPVEIKDYFYKDAKIDGTKITSLSKEVKEDKDTGDKTTVYSYTADGKTVEITDDTTITLEYEAADKIVKVDASCVDEFGDSIADKYTNIELPEFASDGTLALDDVKNPPVENVQVRKNLFKVIKYTYVQATIDNKIIKGLKKTEAKLAEDSKDTSSDDSKSYVYSYTTDGETWTKIKADTTVKFEYSDGKKTTFTYEDDNVVVTATLQHAGAIPDDAELKVTPVTSTTDGYNYDAYMQALNDNADKIAAESGNDIETESAATNDASTEKYTADNTLLYDIAFMADKTDDDGNVIEGEKQEYEPTDGMVKVSMVFKKKQLTEDIQATDAGDITVVHMPLTDAAKENVDTTADATNIDASDVKIETLAEQAIALKDGNHDQVDFAAKDFSIYVFSSGNKQGNYWSGTRTFTSGEIIDALGWATDYAVVSNKIYNNAHIEGNVATGDFEPSQGGSEGLNNASRIYKNNSLSSITVTKTVQNGSDGTFKFAAYQGSTIVGKAFTITTSNKTGSITLTPVSDSAIFTALSNAPVYIYELDGDGKIVDDGGTNGTYTVSYNTVDDENTTTEHSNVINSTTLNNLIGKLTISEGMTFGQTYFGPAGTITVFGSGSIDGWSGNNLQLTTADGVITTVTDFKNISSSPTEYFKINTGIASKISKKLSDLTGYSATLAEAINGATGTSSPTAGGLNVINVISTTGNLQNDLSAAYFNDVQNGGFITGMLSKAASESEADSASEYLLINIDCTGRDTYSLSQLHIDGFNPDSDDAFSRLSSHVIYNFVTKNVDGTYSAYDGNITNTDVVVTAQFGGKKTLTGKTLAAGMFTFNLKGTSANDSDYTDTATNAADGSYTFKEITYKATGTYTYEVSEANGGTTVDGIKYDDKKYTVTVKVTDDGKGKLVATPSENAASLNFSNSYTTNDVTAQFGGKKTLTGKTLAAGMFTFNLKGTSANDSDYTDTATNAADGSYTFKEITYKATGTYTYEVSEANGGTTVDGIKYDDKKYTVTVKVTDDGKGKLVATPSENAASLNFSNSYTRRMTDLDL
jgi:pilin isopeptide linkage protein